MDFVANLIGFFNANAQNTYIGEPITQLEHALQTAQAAIRHKARDELVTAALLHDIGHFLHSYDEFCADDDIDSQHEMMGEQFLRRYFKADVAELVKHHVNAKRYLSGVDPEYIKNLSEASLHSLSLQGGAMNPAEIKEFSSHPLFNEIILLRRWDDAAKIPNRMLPDIASFQPILNKCLIASNENTII